MSASGGYQRRRNFFRKEDGSITVEFVVTFPLILAALAFSFEFGRMFVAHHTIVNNVRSAVRYLSRSDLSAARQTEAEQIVRTGVPSGGAEPEWVESADIQIVPSQSTFTDANFRTGGQIVRVQATVNFRFLIATFIGDERATIPIVIVEDIRHIGD